MFSTTIVNWAVFFCLFFFCFFGWGFKRAWQVASIKFFLITGIYRWQPWHSRMLLGWLAPLLPLPAIKGIIEPPNLIQPNTFNKERKEVWIELTLTDFLILSKYYCKSHNFEIIIYSIWLSCSYYFFMLSTVTKKFLYVILFCILFSILHLHFAVI